MVHSVLFALAFGACLAPANAFAHGGQLLSQCPCPIAEPTGLASDGDRLWISDMATRLSALQRSC